MTDIDQYRALCAENLGRTIVINTDADFTPAGKRTVRVVSHHHSGRKMPRTIAWYVGQRLYAYQPLTTAGIDLSKKWRDAEKSR